MKSFVLRYISGSLFFTMIAVLLMACNSNQKEAAATAKNFLQAYYTDLDFDKALQLSSEVSHAAIKEHAEYTALNPYAKEETPDIVFGDLEMAADNADAATYTYKINRVEKSLPLRKIDGNWRIDLRGGTVESGGNSEYSTLSSGTGGFAASASGEVKYKPRRSKKVN